MTLRFVCLVGMALGTTVSSGVSAQPAARDIKVAIHKNLRYREGPSPSWRLDLAVPEVRGGKLRPGIVVIHGGGWIEGDKSSFTSREHGVPGNIEDFAALGFVAATINYRLAREAVCPAALDDCRQAVRWLRAHAKDYHLDPHRIGAYGNSAGGHLALLLGMENANDKDESNRVQAVVSDSGPIDLTYQFQHNRLRGVVGQFMGGPPEGARAALYRKASPSTRIGPRVPPLILIYGGADEQVPVETADEFVAELGRAGLKDVTYYRLAYVDHCPHSLIRVAGLRPVVNDFFLRTLMHPETAQAIKRRPASR